MFDVLGDLNWSGILAGFVAFVVLGGLWFALLFSKAYNARSAATTTPHGPPRPCSTPARR